MAVALCSWGQQRKDSAHPYLGCLQEICRSRSICVSEDFTSFQRTKSQAKVINHRPLVGVLSAERQCQMGTKLSHPANGFDDNEKEESHKENADQHSECGQKISRLTCRVMQTY